MKIELTKRFLKALKSLSLENQNAAQRTLKKIEQDHVPKSINLRPLKGNRGRWIVNVNNKYRIIGERSKTTKNDSGKGLRLLDIGSHDTIYNKWGG